MVCRVRRAVTYLEPSSKIPQSCREVRRPCEDCSSQRLDHPVRGNVHSLDKKGHMRIIEQKKLAYVQFLIEQNDLDMSPQLRTASACVCQRRTHLSAVTCQSILSHSDTGGMPFQQGKLDGHFVERAKHVGGVPD